MSTCCCYRSIVGRSFDLSRRWHSSGSMARLQLPSSSKSPSVWSSSYRSYHNTPIWCNSPESTTDKEGKQSQEDTTAKNKKKNLFPWQPLPRNREAEPIEHSSMAFWMDVFSGNNQVQGLSRRQGAVEKSTFVRIEKNLRALFFLKISMFQSILENEWMSELVESSAWGFAHAVGSLLSNMSHDVPLDQIMKTDGDAIVVDFSGTVFHYVPKEMSPAIHNMLEKRLIASYYKESAPPIVPLQPPSKNDTETSAAAADDIQPPLEPFHVKLKMKVLGGRLVGFDMVEFVTRAMAEEDPSQKTFLKEAHAAYQSSVMAYYRTLENLGLYQMQLRGASSVSFTIIMEVMVDCEEIFTVTDSNGNVVQGVAPSTTTDNDDEASSFQPTSHLVRFENVVDFDVVQRTFQVGSWMITDWDDLLEGNMWLET